MSAFLKLLVLGGSIAVLTYCGKKEDDKASSAPADVAISSLSIKCGEYACVGTEGK